MSHNEITDKKVSASDEEASPAELLDSNLDDRYSREFTIADNDHPLVVTAGSKEELKSSVPPRVHRMLSDELYQDPDVFWREWTQNHVAACLREAQRVIRDDHPDGEDALYHEVEHDHPALDSPRTIRLPKTQEEVLRMARDLGYDPTIEYVVDIDERKVTSMDNGIGMTTAESIEAWNEPVQSGSGTDQLSAGTKGIGSLTWFAISGDDGLAMVKTNTRRTTTVSGSNVPPRDREGYWFAAYLGGILPASGDVEDGYYGTRFEIPVREGLSMHSFKSSLEKYIDLPPIKILYTVKEGGEKDTEEYPPTFFGQHIGDRHDDSHPAIHIRRPGEFNIALDSDAYINDTRSYKYRNETDTWLLNFAIDRNAGDELEFETLYNDHLQLENEQGLIVAGPNRGKLSRNVEELYGDASDITNPDAPMPDVPLPEPTSSRDQFERGEALTRFLKYANHLAMQEEVDRIADFVNGMLNTTDEEDLMRFLRRNNEQYPLFRKMAESHGDGLGSYHQIWNWFARQSKFDFDPDDAPVRAIREYYEDWRGDINTDRYTEERHIRREHPKAHVIEMVHKLETSQSFARQGYGNPDRKKNRTKQALYKKFVVDTKWPIFVGATLNHDKCKVIWNTYPKAAIIKTSNYSTWQQSPWNARLVKDVPLENDEESNSRFKVPETIHAERQAAKKRSGQSGVNLNADLKIRTEGKANVQLRRSWQNVHDALVDADFGEYVDEIGGQYLVVFTRGGDLAISDHYGLSGYNGVSIVNVTKGQARDLLQFEQVFTHDSLKEYCEDLSFPAYYPSNGHYYEVDLLDIYEDRRSLLINSNDRRLAALLQRKDYTEVDIWEDRQHYLHGQQKMLDLYYGSGTAAKPDDRIVFYTDDQLPWMRLHFGYYGDKPNVTFGWQANRPPKAVRNRYSTLSFSSFSKYLDRTAHPAWTVESGSWKRMDAYRLKSFEKEMYKACRDLGIDPFDFQNNPKQLRYLLTARCKKGGRR